MKGRTIGKVMGEGWRPFASQEFFTGRLPVQEFFSATFVGIFFGKFPLRDLAIKLIENDAALFYYRGCTLN